MQGLSFILDHAMEAEYSHGLHQLAIFGVPAVASGCKRFATRIRPHEIDCRVSLHQRSTLESPFSKRTPPTDTVTRELYNISPSFSLCFLCSLS